MRRKRGTPCRIGLLPVAPPLGPGKATVDLWLERLDKRKHVQFKAAASRQLQGGVV